jgi:type VI secretion system secreted protein VgrG
MSTQANRNCRVSTPLGADVLLFHRMTGSEALSELGEYQLDLLSETSDLKIDAVLGHPLSVKLDASADVVREFNGIVTRFVMTGRLGRYASYQATVRPWLWFLTRSADCRIFQGENAVAIIKKIFKKYSLADFDLEQLSVQPPDMPYCVQYRETDFAFVSRLLERFGIYYYFRHAGGRHTLVLADSPASHKPIAGKSTLQYFPDVEGRARPQEAVHSWQAGGEILSDAYTLAAFNFETPAAPVTAKSKNKRPYDDAAGNLEMYDYPGAFLERAGGESEARIRLESIAAGYQTVQGASSTATLSAGGLFKLSDHPCKDQNGEMLVVAASYQLYSDRFEANPAVTASDVGELPPPFACQFSAIAKGCVFRGTQQTARPLMRGPQTAIVVGNPGDEIWTDKYGRIKVKFHWDRVSDETKDPEKCSCWVRVAQAWAGKRYGQVFIPRVGQEVVVSFLEGDPDQPLVTGSVYNAQNMPPLKLPEEASRSTIKTNTTKGGEGFNEIRFEDMKNAEEVFIQAEKDFNCVVKNNHTLKVGFEKKDKGDQTITIFHDQSLDVGNDRKVHVKNDQTVGIDNNLATTVKKDETRKVGNNQTINVDNNLATTVKKDETRMVGNNQTINVDNNLATTVKKDETHSVGKNQTVKVTGDQKVKAEKTMVLEAGTSIELKVGGSSIKIEAGKITIKSKEIALKADGMMSLKSGGALSAEGSIVKIN